MHEGMYSKEGEQCNDAGRNKSEIIRLNQIQSDVPASVLAHVSTIRQS